MRIARRIELERERLGEVFAPFDHLGVLRSLILGQLTPGNGEQGLLRLLGWIHLFGTSGIHLYGIALWLQWMLRAVARFKPRWTIPLTLLSRVGWVPLVSGVWVLGGMRLGMLRPWIMVGLRALARALGFRWAGFAPLVLASAAEILFALYLGERTGWQGRAHAILAVWGGLSALEHFGKKRMLRDHIVMSIGSWVPTALLAIVMGEPVALATPLLSLISVPIIASVVYPLGVLSVLALWMSFDPLAMSILSFGSMAISAVIGLGAHPSLAPWNLWWVSKTGLCLGAGVAAASVIFCEYISRHKLATASVLMAAVGIWIQIRSDSMPRSARIVQLDVGQGDSALVLTDQVGLVDAGPERSLGLDDWLEILGRNQARKIDWVLITHLDEDHIGGLESLVRVAQVRCVAISASEQNQERALKWKTLLGEHGILLRDLRQGCEPFPSIALRSDRKSHGNSEMSGVFVPLGAGRAWVSLGDASEMQERSGISWIQNQMIKQEVNRLIWKVSHHGSRFSSSSALLNALPIERAWISAGIGNRYGHPAQSTLQRLLVREIPIENTAESGLLRAEGDRHRR